MKTFKEITTDKGTPLECSASDNFATYIITSSFGRDMVADFKRKYNRMPSSKWYNSHFGFEKA